ncbi:MAG: hypothetical protein U5N86_04990 [Planctomycetota bacterium]|nr:hypothetical protein [Planctomycetota bacterium]
MYVMFWMDKNNTPHVTYYNFGFYVDWMFMEESLEIWADLCVQDGDHDDPAIAMGAIRFWGGFEYTFEHDSTPKLGLDILFIQGQEDDTLAFNVLKEDYDRTFVAEAYGDILPRANEGYISVQLQGGMSSLYDGKLELGGTVTWFQADGDLSGNRGDGLGYEVDLFGIYHYSEDVTFAAAMGYFLPDEDLAGFDDPDAVTLFVFQVWLDF